MYKKMRLRDIVRIAPELLGNPVDKAVKTALRNKLEGLVDKKLGAIVAILDVVEVGEGHILAGDGAIYYDTVFDAIVFMPEIQEIVEGNVVEVVEYGAFVGIGPLDGLVHISQITDEYISYDEKNSRLVTRESNRSINEGDRVRARIVTVSLNDREPRDSKIGLTMRQHALGRLEWIEEDLRAKEKKPRPEEAKERKGKKKRREKEEKKEESKTPVEEQKTPVEEHGSEAPPIDAVASVEKMQEK